MRKRSSQKLDYFLIFQGEEAVVVWGRGLYDGIQRCIREMLNELRSHLKEQHPLLHDVSLAVRIDCQRERDYSLAETREDQSEWSSRNNAREVASLGMSYRRSHLFGRENFKKT